MEREQTLLRKPGLVQFEKLLEPSCGPRRRGDGNSSVNLISRDRASDVDSGSISRDEERTWRMTLFQESMEAQEPTEHSGAKGEKRTRKAWCRGRKRRGGPPGATALTRPRSSLTNTSETPRPETRPGEQKPYCRAGSQQTEEAESSPEEREQGINGTAIGDMKVLISQLRASSSTDFAVFYFDVLEYLGLIASFLHSLSFLTLEFA
ncbi:unnamed protein product [Rangifer tarandus platyrhynchus]|uniref:Uncharacterized protein n=1 Tax=Rangifer tarandus platyrhynchus TaxID=3082113 RepID=A0ABN8XNV0_RANTA|nr:unnamed protein product [Rangifer tarandus platyrhynchus]